MAAEHHHCSSLLLIITAHHHCSKWADQKPAIAQFVGSGKQPCSIPNSAIRQGRQRLQIEDHQFHQLISPIDFTNCAIAVTGLHTD
jgi:hypothetical protein